MIIRPEAPADYAAIETINKQAFADHPYSQQTEHLIVAALRAASALTISLVAETEGAVFGHIAFSPALIDGRDLGWYTLGPVAVSPAHQRQGIGSQLVRAGLAALRQQGARGCLLVGEPHFYERFGFRHSDLLTVPEIPPEFFLCLAFDGEETAGTVEHHPAFYVTS